MLAFLRAPLWMKDNDTRACSALQHQQCCQNMVGTIFKVLDK